METLEEVLHRADAAYTAGDLHEAARCYEAAVCIKPGHWYSVFCLGTVMAALGSDGFAIPLLSQAIELHPERKNIEAIYNLGLSMRRQGHVKSARLLYDLIFSLDPNHVEALSAMAGSYINEGSPEKAIEYADRALSIAPENVRAKHHKGLALMELGKQEGFGLYENRFFLPEWTKRCYPWPRWDGSKVGTLLIHGEQGIGDEILFMSWLPKLKDRYDRLIIECTPRLVKTFERTFGVLCYGTDKEVVANETADAVIAMGSLPHAAGGLPPHGGYLKPALGRVEHYRNELRKIGPGPYIGITWHGGVVRTHAHHRTTDHRQWSDIATLGTVISLQYGDRAREADELGIPHWTEAIADLDELVALIAAMDLVVTVNNTTVHMAGALDIPCWTLTPSKPAWRYGLSGEAMSWYRSVRQFRQVGNDWTTVFGSVRRELAAFVEKKKAA